MDNQPCASESQLNQALYKRQVTGPPPPWEPPALGACFTLLRARCSRECQNILDVAFPRLPSHPESPLPFLLHSSTRRDFSGDQVQGREASALLRPPGRRRGATHPGEGTGAEGSRLCWQTLSGWSPRSHAGDVALGQPFLKRSLSPTPQLSKQLHYLFSLSSAHWAPQTKFAFCTFLEGFNNLPVRTKSPFLLN